MLGAHAYTYMALSTLFFSRSPWALAVAYVCFQSRRLASPIIARHQRTMMSA